MTFEKGAGEGREGVDQDKAEGREREREGKAWAETRSV